MTATSSNPALAVDRGELVLLAVILLIGFACRVATVLALDFQPESDYLGYQTMALNLLRGQGIVDSMGNYAMLNVGYPLFVLAPVFAISGNSLLVAQLGNAMLGVGSVLLCHAIARELGAGRSARLLAAALFALYLPSWVYAEYLAKENLMTPLMLGVIWCLLRYLERPSAAVVAGCGVLLGLLALTGNAGLAIVPAALLAVICAPSTIRGKVSAIAMASVLAFVVLAPWLARNNTVIGAAVLNTNGGFNLYLGNNPAATGLFVSISETPRGATWGALRESGEYQAAETLRRDAVLWIKRNPRRFSELALRKAMLFWKPPVHEGKGPPSFAESMIRRLWLLEYVAIVCAAASTVFFRKLWTRKFAVILLAIVAYTAVHMIFYVIYRYREPVIPLVCIMAALAAEQFWLRWGAKRSTANGRGCGGEPHAV